MIGINILAPVATALVLSQLVESIACTPINQGQCCKAMKSAMGNKVYNKDNPLYDERMGTYWSTSAALEPWCIVQPSTAEDVSEILKMLSISQCPFGVRGGGHGSFDGSNSVSEGVTIDFGNMNGTTYDPVSKVASVQPGGHWQTVYETLAPHGVVVTGGRAGTVGTGGFVSGGGNSFHSASHGMACDQVRNFEVVIANGSIINANAQENSDLWVALKGSSANFGLITRFDMNAIDFPDPAKPDIWGGNYIYSLDAGDQVIDSLVDFTDNVEQDLNSSAIIYWAYIPAIGGMILNAAVENTVGIVAPPAFDGFQSVNGLILDGTQIAPMSNVTEELGSGQPAGFRNVWLTASFANNADIMKYAVQKHYDLTAELETVLASDSGFNTLCMFQPITKAIADRGVEMGGNVMGLDEYTANGNGIMFLLTLAINGADQEALARPYMAAYMADLENKAIELGVHWDWKYLNYADRTQDPISTFGSTAISKMQAASAKYDPTGVFQNLRAGGFKLP